MFSFSCHQPEFLFYEEKENVFGSTASIHMRGYHEVRAGLPFPILSLQKSPLFIMSCGMRWFPLRKQNKTKHPEGNFLPLVTCFKADVEGVSGTQSSDEPGADFSAEGIPLVFAGELSFF